MADGIRTQSFIIDKLLKKIALEYSISSSAFFSGVIFLGALRSAFLGVTTDSGIEDSGNIGLQI